MPVRVYPVGAILKEWRTDKGLQVLGFTIELIEGGMTGTAADIMLFLGRLEASEEWNRPYSCDSFDELLEAVDKRVRRGSIDDRRWMSLYLAITPYRAGRIAGIGPAHQ